MNLPNDLQRSELVIARILELLMEWGVQESELQFKELNLDDEYKNFYYPCIYWLEAEGIIRVGKVQRTLDDSASGYVMNPVLTAFGLRVLGTSLEFGKSETLSDAVVDVSRGNTSYSKIGDFLGSFAGGLTKSLGS